MTRTAAVTGAARGSEEWIRLDRAVVAFDHPQEAMAEHALCIDFGDSSAAPSARIAVELDAASARRLAETILAALDDPESRALADPGLPIPTRLLPLTGVQHPFVATSDRGAGSPTT